MSQHFWTTEAAIIEAQHIANKLSHTMYVVRRWSDAPITLEYSDHFKEWKLIKVGYPDLEIIAEIEPHTPDPQPHRPADAGDDERTDGG